MAKKAKPESKPMSQEALKKMIGMIIRLDRQISLRERHLKTLKAALTREARLRKAEQKKTDGGGWSWLFEGTGGNVARVTKHGDTLRSEIEAGSELLDEVVAICVNLTAPTLEDERAAFNQLFERIVKYVPVTEIRKKAVEVLGDDKAEKLIHLITNSGKTTVSFETKQRGGDNDERKEK